MIWLRWQSDAEVVAGAMVPLGHEASHLGLGKQALVIEVEDSIASQAFSDRLAARPVIHAGNVLR